MSKAQSPVQEDRASKQTSSTSLSDLEFARELIRMGVPVFVSELKPDGDPIPPERWQHTKPDLSVIDTWKPGMALCAVMGTTFDVLDIDPRNGGEELYKRLCSELGDNYPEIYGETSTPSDGIHYWIAPLGIGKHTNFYPGLDLQGGRMDGTSRGFVFIPPTVRPSKAKQNEGLPGKYEFAQVPSKPDKEDVSGEKLASIIAGSKRGKDNQERIKLGKRPLTESTAYEVICQALADNGSKRTNKNWQCPAHDDKTPTLTVTDAGDRVLIHCHAGCSHLEILNALGLDEMDMFDRSVHNASDERSSREGSWTMGDERTEAPGGSDGSTGTGEDLELVPMSSVTMKRTDWFWDTGTSYPGSGGRIPKGTLNIGVGRPGAGKGQFACWLAAQVTNGTLPGALNGQKKGVIFYSTEDSYTMTIGPRLIAAGADMDRVYIFTTEAENTSGKFVVMKISQHLERLNKLIDKYDIGLIILDPLLSAMSSNADPNNDPAVRSEIEPLQMMLEESGCTGFGITHFRKMHDDDILNMISGSGAFARVVRSAIAFGAEKDEEGSVTRVISTVKNNLGRTDLPSFTYTFEECKVQVSDGVTYVSKLVMGEETDTSVEEIHERKVTGAKKTKSNLAMIWLQEKLKDGPVAKDDLMAMHAEEDPGFSWGTVEKASAGTVFSDKPYGGRATWKLKF